MGIFNLYTNSKYDNFSSFNLFLNAFLMNFKEEKVLSISPFDIGIIKESLIILTIFG